MDLYVQKISSKQIQFNNKKKYFEVTQNRSIEKKEIDRKTESSNNENEIQHIKMGYCAKARIYSHIYCVIALLSIVSNQVKEMHGASAGSSWPSMKTYDIWGTSHMQTGSSMSTQPNGDNGGDDNSSGGGTMTAANDMVIQDYRHKTSFRDGKGMGNR